MLEKIDFKACTIERFMELVQSAETEMENYFYAEKILWNAETFREIYKYLLIQPLKDKQTLLQYLLKKEAKIEFFQFFIEKSIQKVYSKQLIDFKRTNDQYVHFCGYQINSVCEYQYALARIIDSIFVLVSIKEEKIK